MFYPTSASSSPSGLSGEKNKCVPPPVPPPVLHSCIKISQQPLANLDGFVLLDVLQFLPSPAIYRLRVGVHPYFARLLERYAHTLPEPRPPTPPPKARIPGKMPKPNHHHHHHHHRQQRTSTDKNSPILMLLLIYLVIILIALSVMPYLDLNKLLKTK